MTVRFVCSLFLILSLCEAKVLNLRLNIDNYVIHTLAYKMAQVIYLQGNKRLV